MIKMTDPTMEHKTAHLPFATKSQKVPDFWTIASMNPGVARRHAMVQYFLYLRSQGDTSPYIRVNSKYVLPSTDPDLKVLVRQGVLYRMRPANIPVRKRNTELHLNLGYVPQ